MAEIPIWESEFMESRKLIRGGTVLSMDPEIGNLDRADILIEGGQIVDVSATIESEDAEVINARGHIIAPGFIDGHRHLWESLLKYTGADWSTPDYYHGVRGVFGPHFRAEDVYAGNLLGAVEAIDAGVTTIIDCCHNLETPEHADAAVTALQDAGIRALFAHGNANSDWVPLVNDSVHSEDARRIQKQFFSSSDQLLTMALCLRGPQWSPVDTVRWEFEMARDMGVRITFPVGMGRWSDVHPIELIDDMGLADGDIVYSHANVLTERELHLIRDTGASVAITPERELTGGSGTVATGRLLEFGIRPSIGIDMNIAVAGDMFGAMRHTLAAERSRQHRVSQGQGTESIRLDLTAADVLEFATIEGARACGLEHKVGSITPGKQADIILVRTNSLNMAPLNNPLGALVFGANQSDVRTVLIAGNVVKRDGRLTQMDPQTVIERATKARDHVFSGAGRHPGSFDWSLDSEEWTATASR